MENEQTNKTDTQGTEPVKPVETPDKPLSLYEKTEAIVTRQEEANKKTEELLERQEKLHANQRLAGTAGGHVETKLVSDEEKKKAGAKEFFKGTALESDINKYNG